MYKPGLVWERVKHTSFLKITGKMLINKVVAFVWQKDCSCVSKCSFLLAPLAEGQRAIVMAWGRRASVRPFVRACVRKLFL